jgi:ATP-dependent Lon protease
MECRRRVREHILRIDDTFKRHDFVFRSLASGEKVTVLTPEEILYPAFSVPRLIPHLEGLPDQDNEDEVIETPASKAAAAAAETGHVVIPENSRGWSYKRLFASHLKGASEITIRDPYVRMFFQVRNLMEFLQMVHEIVEEGDEVRVHLVTQSDPQSCVKQEENLNQLVDSFTGSKVAFSWEFDHSTNFHARNIVTDTGWKMTIDRGLDLFQKYETGPFSLEQGMQEARLTRGGEVTYLRV